MKFLVILATISFVSFSSIISIQPTIKAKYYVPSHLTNRWQDLLDLEPYLLYYGLEFVDKNPDVILCTYVTEEILSQNKPIIILEKFAAASINEKTRAIIEHPNIKAVFKNRILKNKKWDNKPLVAGRYFNNLINAYAQLIQEEKSTPLSKSARNKIQCVIWDFFGSPFKKKIKRLRDIEIDYKEHRPIDIFFACDLSEKTSKSGAHILFNWHRNAAIQAMRAIKGINCIALTSKIDYWPYIDHTQKSKIIVSPWGFGEYCWRDFEAIHCGAVLIKPDTSFIRCYPDIYQNNITYVPCKPDFSDLEEKVKHILQNYQDYTPMRKRAKKLLVDSWDIEFLAQQFVMQVKKALTK